MPEMMVRNKKSLGMSYSSLHKIPECYSNQPLHTC
ncbi:hypothetical protein HMPREF9413_0012 [Paenibacillus sp. HGF7]|nr:hypothetical protein HMPREF9413_0012 [Paenibacillus sp. HGF7]